VNTNDAVKIDDGAITADVNLKANVANVVGADLAARAKVDLNKPSIEVKIPRLIISVPAGHKEDHGKPGDDHGKPGDDHGKPGEHHGKPGEHHGKPGEHHGIAVKLDIRAKVKLRLLHLVNANVEAGLRVR